MGIEIERRACLVAQETVHIIIIKGGIAFDARLFLDQWGIGQREIQKMVSGRYDGSGRVISVW